MQDDAARELVARVDALLDEVRDERALELVEALVALYGEGLERMMAAANGASAAFAQDELVSHLLLVHDLHPVPAEERVRSALEDHEAELGAIDAGVVRLRLSERCSAGAAEEAVRRAAPEVEKVEFEWPAQNGGPEVVQVNLPQAAR